MGLEPLKEGGKRMYLQITDPSDKDKKKGLCYTKSGTKHFIGAVSGQITNIVKKLNKPQPHHKWRAYWSYEITFFDPDSDPQEMILSLRRDNRNTDQLINSLSSVENPHTIKVSVWEKDGYLKIFLYNGGETKDYLIKWKYGWNPETKDFQSVPATIKTPTKKDAMGIQEYSYDRSERDEFFENEIHNIYEIFTGQKWTSAQVIGDNASNTSNAPKKEMSKSDQILEGVKNTYKTEKSVIDNWGLIARRIVSDIPDFDTKLLLISNLQGYLNGLGDKAFLLKEDGTYKEEVNMADDLPF